MSLDRNAKAFKDDDADIPKHFWDEQVMMGLLGQKYNDWAAAALEKIWALGDTFWWWWVTQSFLGFMCLHHGKDWASPRRLRELSRDRELQRNAVACLDGLSRTWSANWWK